MKPKDLRGILQYIPIFREKIFVIAADGAVVSHINFSNLLLDIAVLRSLNIHVVLVHGAAEQIAQSAKEQSLTPSDINGTGITDNTTLKLAIIAANTLTHEILEGFAANDLRAANANAVTAQPFGVIKGIDYLNTGQVRRIDNELLQSLISKGITPVIPPLGFDDKGNTFRLNSDLVARQIAESLAATKLIFISTANGLQIGEEIERQIVSTDLEMILNNSPKNIPSVQLSKARHAAEACAAGVPRVHIINGLITEGLLAEVFSNEGIGTLVYANEYRQIRCASKKDVASILRLSRDAMNRDQLVDRSKETIEECLGDYFIFEIDDNPIACVALHQYPNENTGELAHLFVNPAYARRGIGQRLVQYAEKQASESGLTRIVTLSTQSFAYFENKSGFSIGSVEDLPNERRLTYESQGRNSKILIKRI